MIINKPFKELLKVIQNPVITLNGIFYEDKDWAPSYSTNEKLTKILSDNNLMKINKSSRFAVENAYKHGGSPIEIKLIIGKKGAIFSVIDPGRGFDFKDIQKKFEEGKKYYKHLGCGFESYNQKGYFVSFEKNGRQTNIILCNKKLIP